MAGPAANERGSSDSLLRRSNEQKLLYRSNRKEILDWLSPVGQGRGRVTAKTSPLSEPT